MFSFCCSWISVRFSVVALVVSYLLAGYACRLSAAVSYRRPFFCSFCTYSCSSIEGCFLLTLRKMLFTFNSEYRVASRRITEACCRVIAMINVLGHIHMVHTRTHTRTHTYTLSTNNEQFLPWKEYCLKCPRRMKKEKGTTTVRARVATTSMATLKQCHWEENLKEKYCKMYNGNKEKRLASACWKLYTLVGYYLLRLFEYWFTIMLQNWIIIRRLLTNFDKAQISLVISMKYTDLYTIAPISAVPKAAIC